MSEIPTGPPPPPAEMQWFYVDQGQPCGPVPQSTLREMIWCGALPQVVYVWREGLANWAPASAFPELLPAQAAQGAPPLPLEAQYLAKSSSNATKNCITMFVLFCLTVILALVAATGTVGPKGGGGAVLSFWLGALMLGGAVFAAIYLPARWRMVMSRPLWVKALGLIGGFGLIAILTLGFFMAAVAFVGIAAM